MQLYVIEIITQFDGGVAKQISPAGTLDDAKMMFHQSLASAYANTSIVKEALVMIVDGNGSMFEKDHFDRDAQL